MVEDPELRAMAEAFRVIEPLDAEAQARVLLWLRERLKVAGVSTEPVDEAITPETPSPKPAPSKSTGTPIGKIASALALTEEEAELLMNLQGEVVDVDLPPTMLPDSDAKSMRELALVLTAAAEAIGRPYLREDLKTAMRAHNRDPKNLNRDLAGMDAKLLRLKNESIVLMKEGREQAAEIAQRWVGRDS